MTLPDFLPPLNRADAGLALKEACEDGLVGKVEAGRYLLDCHIRRVEHLLCHVYYVFVYYGFWGGVLVLANLAEVSLRHGQLVGVPLHFVACLRIVVHEAYELSEEVGLPVGLY